MKIVNLLVHIISWILAMNDEQTTALKRTLVMIWVEPKLKDRFEYSKHAGEISIKTSSLEELAEARHELRELMGKWNDNLDQVFSCLGKGIAVYRNTEYPGLEIWLSTPISEFPNLGKGKNCRFVMEEKKEISYNYVCNNEIAN